MENDKELIEIETVTGLPETEITTETVENKAEGDEELTVSIDGATDDPFKGQAAPKWVKEQRKENSELRKQKRELEEKLKALNTAPSVALGEKPTLESCGYDESKFEAELTAWHSKKRQVDDEAKKRETEAENQRKAWQGTLDSYDTKKKELAVKDYGDAEDVVRDTLSPNQQAFILQGASNPALVVYALGKNPEKAAELASIKDHVKFIYAIARFEGSLKVTNKKAPAPEKQVRGSAGTAILNGADKQLDKLRAEAAKTGNYTQVVAYKKQLRAQGKHI